MAANAWLRPRKPGAGEDISPNPSQPPHPKKIRPRDSTPPSSGNSAAGCAATRAACIQIGGPASRDGLVALAAAVREQPRRRRSSSPSKLAQSALGSRQLRSWRPVEERCRVLQQIAMAAVFTMKTMADTPAHAPSPVFQKRARWRPREYSRNGLFCPVDLRQFRRCREARSRLQRQGDDGYRNRAE